MNKDLPTINKRASKKKLATMAALPMILFVAVTPFYKDAWGVYYRLTDTIFIRNDLDKTSKIYGQDVNAKEYVKIHEFAHFIEDERQSKIMKELYCKSYDDSKYKAEMTQTCFKCLWTNQDFPTQYSKTNCSENFAEIYTGLQMGLLNYDKFSSQHRMVLNAIQVWEQPEEAY